MLALAQAAHAGPTAAAAQTHVPAGGAVAEQVPAGESNHGPLAYRLTLQRADAHLAKGEAVLAAMDYEQAAQIDGEHVEAEIGVSRAHLAAGEFRRALAYAQLVSGEHQESQAALAWNAYLEDRAGYVDRALGRLRASIAKHPGTAAPRAALVEILLERGQPLEAQALLESSGIAPAPRPDDFVRLGRRMTRALEHNTAPAILLQERATAFVPTQAVDAQQLSAPVVDSARALWPSAPVRPWPANFNAAPARGNGVVVAAGNAVLTRMEIKAPGKVYVRNGLGQVRQASVKRQRAGVTLLDLDSAYPEAAHLIASGQNLAPDGVRFCFVFGYALLDAESPGYPFMTPGAVVRDKLGIADLMQITATLGRDQSGSPVFDASGRLIGLAVEDREAIAGIENRERDLGAMHLALRGDAFSDLLSPDSGPQQRAPGATYSVEELYERLLPAIAEVWVLPTKQD